MSFFDTLKPTSLPASHSQLAIDQKSNIFLVSAHHLPNLRYNHSTTRLYCTSFLPQGFFARLIARILSDTILKACLIDLLHLDFSTNANSLTTTQNLGPLIDFIAQKADWRCWQTGIELTYLGHTLLSIKELVYDSLLDHSDYNNIYATHPVLFKDCENELQLKAAHKNSSFVECYSAFKTLTVQETDSANHLVRIQCHRKTSLKLFAAVIEIIDSLLEDWYPDLGTKFMQDSKGEYLVTRLSPCSGCLVAAETTLSMNFKSGVVSGHDSDTINYELIKREIAELARHPAETVKKKLQNADYIYSFMIDDVCYAVMKLEAGLNCPKHGQLSVNVIAPDLAFEDLDDSLIVSEEVLKVEGLLGRGSFGFVYQGYLDLKSNTSVASRGGGNDVSKPSRSLNFESFNKVKVAVKVLESMSKTTGGQRNTSFWNQRKSVQTAAKAYTVARQEIAILSGLRHENIVGMLGLSLRPLAIILELAPLGNLKQVLEKYRKHLTRLSPFIVQQVAVQISGAFVYLHANRVIYRDLKCDNVLVWKFPLPGDNVVRQSGAPHLSNTQLNSTISPGNKFFSISNVLLKLADYSISRSVLPTGTKGFAGTEGFMAPEIVRFNGEETYSEKVDCFSFGMLLYELVSLKLPFEGHDQIKDLILNDVRPLIRLQDSLYPTLMLDLMCLCWLDNPCERPTAKEINTYSKSYEFSHLADVSVLEDYDEAPLVVFCLNREQESLEELELNPVELEEFEEEDVVDVWVVRNSQNEGSSQIEILSFEYSLNCVAKKVINVCPGQVEMLFVYNGNQIWCIDSAKCLYIYCGLTKRKLNQYLLDVKLAGQVVSMYGMESLKRVLVCTMSGSILILNVEMAHEISVSGNRLENDLAFDEGLEYVLVEIPIQINTCLILQTRYEKNFDLWIGSEKAEIFCFSLKEMKLTGSYIHTSSHHYVTNSMFTLTNNPKISVQAIGKTDKLNVAILKTNPNDTFFLWSYVHPGYTIFLWNHVSKKIMSAYNCLRAFEDLHFQPVSVIRNFRIVDISFMNGLLYCAMNNGIVLAMKRLTLTPLFMFNAHMNKLHGLCPLSFDTKLVTYGEDSAGSREVIKTVRRTSHSLISLGRALAPVHEDIYLSSTNYRDRVDALKKYANCLILCSWNCSESS